MGYTVAERVPTSFYTRRSTTQSLRRFTSSSTVPTSCNSTLRCLMMWKKFKSPSCVSQTTLCFFFRVHSQPNEPFDSMTLSIVPVALRNMAMRIVYFKPSWNYNGLTDFMAPSARLQLAGEHLILGMPVSSAAAEWRAKVLQNTDTVEGAGVGSLVKAMFSMGIAEFKKAGGFYLTLQPGTFCLLPANSVIAERPCVDSKPFGFGFHKPPLN